MSNKPKVVAIVGPTSSGKTSLSIALAKQFSGEIVSADSRQVYKGLDIGSGKVTKDEMENIPHHLLDVAEVSQTYTAADFARDANVAIRDILTRDHLPIVAGGTFFYLDQLRGLTLPEVPPNPELRNQLETLSTNELWEKLKIADAARAENIDKNNRRRLIRALEIIETLGHVPQPTEQQSPYEWLVLGIDIPQTQLHQNIRTRLLSRLEDGMVEEVRTLLLNGVIPDRLHELGLEYRYINQYLQGELSHKEMVTKLETKIKQFAKRQLTWLRRDTSIEWFSTNDPTTIMNRVEEFLAA